MGRSLNSVTVEFETAVSGKVSDMLSASLSLGTLSLRGDFAVPVARFPVRQRFLGIGEVSRRHRTGCGFGASASPPDLRRGWPGDGEGLKLRPLHRSTCDKRHDLRGNYVLSCSVDAANQLTNRMYTDAWAIRHAGDFYQGAENEY